MEETFLRQATVDWIGLSALGYSLVMEPGASAPGWYNVGPLALKRPALVGGSGSSGTPAGVRFVPHKFRGGRYARPPATVWQPSGVLKSMAVGLQPGL